MEETPYKINEKENDKEFIKRIKKGGFFEQLFKSINSIKNGTNNIQIELEGQENDDYEDEEEDDDENDFYCKIHYFFDYFLLFLLILNCLLIL